MRVGCLWETSGAGQEIEEEEEEVPQAVFGSHDPVAAAGVVSAPISDCMPCVSAGLPVSPLGLSRHVTTRSSAADALSFFPGFPAALLYVQKAEKNSSRRTLIVFLSFSRNLDSLTTCLTSGDQKVALVRSPSDSHRCYCHCYSHPRRKRH